VQLKNSVPTAINHPSHTQIKAMKKVIALLSGLALLLQALPANAIATQQSKPKTFAQWCQQRNSVPAATKLTIDLLLTEAGTQDCKQANSKLINLTRLDLSDAKISDLQPLTGLTKLTNLKIAGNEISNLQPLAGLTNLTYLIIGGNKITNVKPLSGLNKLTFLSIGQNQIQDIKPLASLINLDLLYLDSNQIDDLKPLAGLSKLTQLNLRDNNIVNLKPLTSLTKLTDLNLGDNNIVNLKPLASLTKLSYLDLGSFNLASRDGQNLPLIGHIVGSAYDPNKKNNNKISDVEPLADLTNLTSLDLSYNIISDISSLHKLKNLTSLNLRGNKIVPQICPVQPLSICGF
jgi:internalin A